uniref:Uncharacterized protein n=1 Tax=Arion vulgaris TaxID=1028688 RepID=A0A0B6ZV30_9EUPU
MSCFEGMYRAGQVQIFLMCVCGGGKRSRYWCAQEWSVLHLKSGADKYGTDRTYELSTK